MIEPATNAFSKIPCLKKNLFLIGIHVFLLLFCNSICAGSPTDILCTKGEHPKAQKNIPVKGPNTFIIANSLHYDPRAKLIVFTGNVVMVNNPLILKADRLEIQEDSQGNRLHTASANRDKKVLFRQSGLKEFESIEGQGQVVQYDGITGQVKIMGHAIITRFLCSQPLNSVHGQSIYYDERRNIYKVESFYSSKELSKQALSLVEWSRNR